MYSVFGGGGGGGKSGNIMTEGLLKKRFMMRINWSLPRRTTAEHRAEETSPHPHPGGGGGGVLSYRMYRDGI